MIENKLWLSKIDEIEWKFYKINEDQWNQWKPMKINEINEINENQWNQWKSRIIKEDQG